MWSWRITSGSCSTDIGGVGTGTDLVAVGSLDNDVLDGGLEGFPSLNVGGGGGAYPGPLNQFRNSHMAVSRFFCT